jgi:hypothetical protein
MFRYNHKLLPTPKTAGYQCDMMMVSLNAAIEYTTHGSVVTLCLRENIETVKGVEKSWTSLIGRWNA